LEHVHLVEGKSILEIYQSLLAWTLYFLGLAKVLWQTNG
jgi:hypothetical protein